VRAEAPQRGFQPLARQGNPGGFQHRVGRRREVRRGVEQRAVQIQQDGLDLAGRVQGLTYAQPSRWRFMMCTTPAST
jgi:hypothetical protein